MDTLAVTEAARGQGVGATLLEAAAAQARTLGLSRVGLLVEDGNRAATLYARVGFRAAGTRTLAGGSYTHLIWTLPG
ncbi:GNAT family N-acetyltransferase [Deinococcus aquaticus]|uniref:GNAT family N-acetyltransferase n=1 Tax=Deinococcus aquaticus TaxID=328692 RepID=UPI00360A0848